MTVNDWNKTKAFMQTHTSLIKCLTTFVFLSSISMSSDSTWEQTLRDDLRYYFMSPCEKYKARRQLPWKLTVQIVKIIMITIQVTQLFTLEPEKKYVYIRIMK